MSERPCSKRLARYRAQGELGLLDRSSARLKVHSRTGEQFVQLLVSLRRLRFTARELADLLGMPVATISGILKRIGLGKLGRLGLEPGERYERACPSELIHIDIEKLGRIQGGACKRITGGSGNTGSLTQPDAAGGRRRAKGWDSVHVAVGDTTRRVL